MDQYCIRSTLVLNHVQHKRECLNVRTRERILQIRFVTRSAMPVKISFPGIRMLVQSTIDRNIRNSTLIVCTQRKINEPGMHDSRGRDLVEEKIADKPIAEEKD